MILQENEICIRKYKIILEAGMEFAFERDCIALCYVIRVL
jgi:hypothetical protein